MISGGVVDRGLATQDIVSRGVVTGDIVLKGRGHVTKKNLHCVIIKKRGREKK